MRVMCLCPELRAPGGIQRYGRHVSAALTVLTAESGSTCAVVSLNDGPGEFGFRVGGTELCGIGFGRDKLGLGLYMARKIRQIDLLYVAHVNLAPLAWSLRRVNPGLRYWVACHGTEVWTPLPLARRYALRRADGIVAVSRDTQEMVHRRQGVFPERIVVISNTIDPVGPDGGDESIVSPPIGSGARLILSVARLRAGELGKGVDTVIQSMPHILAAIPNAYYLVVGDGDDRPRLEQLARECGVDDRVRFAGFVDEDTLRALYQRAEVFAMPSKQEGFGIVFLEAMAYGAPVVALRRGGVDDVVRDGITGRLVSTTEGTEVTAAILSILEDGAFRRGLAEASKRQAATEYSFERFSERLGATLGLGPRGEAQPV